MGGVTGELPSEAGISKCSFFGVDIALQNRVVVLVEEPRRYAIQLEDGSYYGQTWVDDPGSVYGQARHIRCWPSKRMAELILKLITSPKGRFGESEE